MSTSGPDKSKEKLGQYETVAPANKKGATTARRSRRTSGAPSIGSTNEANQVFGITPDATKDSNPPQFFDVTEDFNASQFDVTEDSNAPQFDAIEDSNASQFDAIEDSNAPQFEINEALGDTEELSSSEESENSSSNTVEVRSSESENSEIEFSSDDDNSFSEVEEQDVSSDEELTQPIEKFQGRRKGVAKRLNFEDILNSASSSSSSSSSSALPTDEHSSRIPPFVRDAIKTLMDLSTTVQSSRILPLIQNTVKALIARPTATATSFGLGLALVATGFVGLPVASLAIAATFAAVEATRYARATIAKWHYNDAVKQGFIDEATNQVIAENAPVLSLLDLEKGSQAETSWKAYAEHAYQAPKTFIPFSQASAAYQVGREMKRLELEKAANSPTVDSPATETPACCANKPK